MRRECCVRGYWSPGVGRDPRRTLGQEGGAGQRSPHLVRTLRLLMCKVEVAMPDPAGRHLPTEVPHWPGRDRLLPGLRS